MLNYYKKMLVKKIARYSFLVLGFISFFLFISCDNRSTLKRRIKREVTKMVGRPLDLGFEVDEVWKDTVAYGASFPNDCYRIVTFIPVKSSLSPIK